jgi:thiol-disulfide isomerase/thioredoxin
MAIRPVVDEVEREFAGRLTVVRLNVQDPAGSQVAQAYGFEYTPTFILLDGAGNEIWRAVYALDPAEIRRRLTAP